MTAYEIESKIELDQNDFHRLLDNSHVYNSFEQLNVYYDNHGELSCSSATFRVRFIPNSNPVMTLKLPVSNEFGIRKSLEVEQQINNRMQKQIEVQRDLPEEFVS